MTNQGLWYRRFGPPEQVLTLESNEPAPAGDRLRVSMHAAPINPSDLIPISGAYRYRIQLPQVAGYEGVGRVTAAPAAWQHLLGRRVLPLRANGTWQQQIDCQPEWLVSVPDTIGDDIALRGYINPLAALRMLDRWPVSGRIVLLSAAGSQCAALLAQWARASGAQRVIGLCRSAQPAARLQSWGVETVVNPDAAQLATLAAQADITFDAVGGELATALLASMRPQAAFVSYGLLSGKPYNVTRDGCQPQRFHLRDSLATVTPAQWQQWFTDLWPLLASSQLPPLLPFAFADWRYALRFSQQPGRAQKPVLQFS